MTSSQLRHASQVALLVVLSLVVAVPLVQAADGSHPTASFTVSLSAPVTGEQVTFTSTSRDAGSQAWDLDDDGFYDDGTAATADRTFAAPGSYTVPIAPPLLSPFPLVRILGVTTRVGARLDLLSVRTTGGTRILVLCKGKGKGCPWARKAQTARFGTSSVRTVRIPGFRRRYLRAGAAVELYVTRAGMIGKYTRFEFRKLKPPVRVDRCTAVGLAQARRCPAR